MSIQIKLFGLLADVVGRQELNMNGTTDTDSLRKNLLNDFPKLKNYQFVIAVGKRIINRNQALNREDKVALLPPFAGG